MFLTAPSGVAVSMKIALPSCFMLEVLAVWFAGLGLLTWTVWTIGFAECSMLVGIISLGALSASLGMVGTSEPATGKWASLSLDLADHGQVKLNRLIARDSGIEIYLTNQPGVVAKLFDLDCGKPDEISYGPYLDFTSELENFEDLQNIEELRPYVPAYYGANIDYTGKYAFVAMEYIAGEDLSSWCRNAAAEAYPPAWVLAFRQVVYETLAIMRLFHKHGIILIDFKPDDIFLQPDGGVRFVDMGAFFTPRHARESNKYVYSTTPDHAELIIDSSNVPTGVPLTKASDIFSAGVALFEMATGASRLVIDGPTADEILGNPAIYLFHDSQIRDVWRSNAELKAVFPLIETQLKERRILFAALWQVLKGYLTSKLPDWDSLNEAQRDQILLTTGTTFILEQLPPRLQWLAGAIAQATTLRGARLKTVAELMKLLCHPASESALVDLRRHNCLVQLAADLGHSLEFIDHLNTWEVRLSPQTLHWSLSSSLASGYLADDAQFTFLRQVYADDQGHRYYQIVDDLAADDYQSGKLSLWHLQFDRYAWIGF